MEILYAKVFGEKCIVIEKRNNLIIYCFHHGFRFAYSFAHFKKRASPLTILSNL